MISGNLALTSAGASVDANAKVTNKSSKNNGLDFGSIMSQSLSTKANEKDSSLYTNIANLQNKGKMNDTSKDIKVSTEDSGSKLNDKSKNDMDSSVDKLSVNKADKLSDNQVDDVKESLEELKEEIKKTLGVTDDEFEAAMEVLGLTLQDLLKPNNMTELVANLTGQDGAMSLLTNGDLTEQLKHLLEFASDVIKDLSQKLEIPADELRKMLITSQGQETFAKNLADAGKNIEENEEILQKNETNQTDVTEKVLTKQPNASNENAGNPDASSSNQEFGKNTKTLVQSHNEGLSGLATNLTQSLEQSIQGVLPEAEANINATDIVQQIMDNVKVLTTENLQSIEMQLNPENLGKLHLTVTAKDGIMTAQITAQDEAVRKVIESQIAVLKENFNNQGLKVDAVEVMVESHAFENGQEMADGEQQNNAGARGRRKINAADLADLGIDDSQNQAEIQDLADGSSVNFRA